MRTSTYSIKTTVLSSVLFAFALNILAQTTNKNYVRTITPNAAFTSEQALYNTSSSNKIEEIKYFDGLGRDQQVVNRQFTPNSKDLVQPIIYDQFGRQTISFLPYADPSSDGSFKTAAINNQSTFYKNGLRVAHSNYPFSETVFDNSPLNRVFEQSAPGNDWKLGNGHTVKYNYRTNYHLEVRLWEVTGSLHAVSNMPYKAKELYVTQTFDEHGNITLEYKDRSGKIVLIRKQSGWASYPQFEETYETSKPEGSGTTEGEVSQTIEAEKSIAQYPVYHETYFVYNDLGNLSVVIPPKAMTILNNTGFNTANLNDDLIYQYKYDARRRVIKKKVPAAGWTFYIYNTLDQVVLSQTEVQREQKQWSFFKYDALGRMIQTGLFNALSYYEAHGRGDIIQEGVFSDTWYWQNIVNYSSPLWEQTSEENFNINHGYTRNAFPQDNIEIHTVNYYDNYDFDSNGDADYTFRNAPIPCINQQAVVGGTTPVQCIPFINTVSKRTHGRATASKVKILDATSTVQWLTSVNFYDEKGRIIQIQSNNQFGGTDIVDNVYNFSGQIIHTALEHIKTPASAPLVILNKYVYDNGLRLTKVYQKNNNDAPVLLAQNKYNELGQLIEKNLNQTNAGALQSVDYAYNIRGWLTHINNADLTNDKLVLPHSTTGEAEKVSSIALKSIKMSLKESEVSEGNKAIELNVAEYKNVTLEKISNPADKRNLMVETTKKTKVEQPAEDPLAQLEMQKIIEKEIIVDLNNMELEEGLTTAQALDLITARVTEQLISYGVTSQSLINKIAGQVGVFVSGNIGTVYYNDDNNDLFGMELKYNKSNAGFGSTAQFNGNIAEINWKTATDQEKRGYGFNYDMLNRLTIASFAEFNPTAKAWTDNKGRFDVSGITYDENGNILTLKQNGFLENSTFGEIDNLTYAYSGNKLTSVNDASMLKGFNDFSDNGYKYENEFVYDKNGNLTNDPHKRIEVTYNHLNLPVRVKFGSGSEINYTYAANGRRLQKKVSRIVEKEWQHSNTFYSGAFVYSDFGLDFIVGSEGRIVPEENSAQQFRYEYNYKDHLGNTRLTFADLNKDGSIDKNTEVLQQAHYYPFGMEMKGLQTTQIGQENKYKFGGKELDDELGLNWYDFGARNYDPQLGRWMQVDPLAEKTYNWTPYRYGFNNPLRYNDPTGLYEGSIIDYEVQMDANQREYEDEGNENDGWYANEDTRYYDRNGKLIHHSKDNLEDGVVVLEDKDLAGFNNRLEMAKRNGWGDDDLLNQRWRNDYGPTYMVNEYWQIFEENDAPFLINGKPNHLDLRNEVGFYNYNKNGQIRPGDERVPGDYESTDFNKVPAEGDNVSRGHTHPNVGRSNGMKPGLPNPSGRDLDNGPETGSKYYNIVVEKNQIVLYQKSALREIHIPRNAFK